MPSACDQSVASQGGSGVIAGSFAEAVARYPADGLILMVEDGEALEVMPAEQGANDRVMGVHTDEDRGSLDERLERGLAGMGEKAAQRNLTHELALRVDDVNRLDVDLLIGADAVERIGDGERPGNPHNLMIGHASRVLFGRAIVVDGSRGRRRDGPGSRHGVRFVTQADEVGSVVRREERGFSELVHEGQAGLFHPVDHAARLAGEEGMEEQRRDGDDQSVFGGDQRLGDSAGEGLDVAGAEDRHQAEGVDDAGDRAEKAEERGGGGGDRNKRKEAFEAQARGKHLLVHHLLDQLARLADVSHPCQQHAADGTAHGGCDLERSCLVAAGDGGEKLLDASPRSGRDEKHAEPLEENDQRGRGGEREDRNHHRPALFDVLRDRLPRLGDFMGSAERWIEREEAGGTGEKFRRRLRVGGILEGDDGGLQRAEALLDGADDRPVSGLENRGGTEEKELAGLDAAGGIDGGAGEARAAQRLVEAVDRGGEERSLGGEDLLVGKGRVFVGELG